MSKDVIRILITSVVALLFIGLIVLFCMVDVNLGFIKTTSIANLLKKHEEVISAETKVGTQEVALKNSLSTLSQEQQNYKTEKSKYDAISEETINTIKEATTQENYDIEYMWIKLGNYAKMNNLSIVITEPNGKSDNSTSNKPTDGTSDTTTTTSGGTTTPGTDNSTPNTSTSTLFKMQVTGSYINVSDFVFEVENDKELRFKLDNIVMEYVSGTTIKATFNVKNLNVKK